MALESVIVIVDKDKTDLGDGSYFKKVLETYKDVSGFSVGEKGGITSFCDNVSTTFDGDEGIKAVREAYKDNTIVFYFAKSSLPLGEEDLPPYHLCVDKDEKPIVVGYLDGAFPAFEQAESAHPPVSYAVGEFLQELCQNTFLQQSDDLDKTWEVFETPFFQRQIRNFLQPSGTLVLLTNDGRAMSFHEGKTSAKLEFGWTSNIAGYSPTLAKEEKPAPTGPKTKAQLLREKMEQRLGKKPVVEAPKTDTKIPADAGKPAEDTVAPPANVSDGRELRKWYNRHRTTGWEGNMHQKGGKYKRLDPDKREAFPVSELRDNSPLKPMPGQKTPPKEGVEVDVPTIIPPGEKKDLDHFLKIDLLDVEKVQEIEDKYPLFTEQEPMKTMGIKIEDVVRWPDKKLRELIATRKQATYALIRELGYALLDAQAVKRGRAEEEKKSRAM